MSKYEGQELEGPWAFEEYGEKCSSIVVGIFMDKDDKQLSGQVESYDEEGNESGIIRIEDICDLPDSVFSGIRARLIADAPRLALENEKLLVECERLREALGAIDDYGAALLTGEDAREMQQISSSALESTEPEVCRWRRREKNTAGANRWHSECGLGCASASEGIEAPDMNYCPACGKPLEIVTEEKEA